MWIKIDQQHVQARQTAESLELSHGSVNTQITGAPGRFLIGTCFILLWMNCFIQPASLSATKCMMNNALIQFHTLICRLHLACVVLCRCPSLARDNNSTYDNLCNPIKRPGKLLNYIANDFLLICVHQSRCSRRWAAPCLQLHATHIHCKVLVASIFLCCPPPPPFSGVSAK